MLTGDATVILKHLKTSCCRCLPTPNYALETQDAPFLLTFILSVLHSSLFLRGGGGFAVALKLHFASLLQKPALVWSSPEGRPTLLRSAARISRTFSPSFLTSFLFLPELRRKGGVGGGVRCHLFSPQASHQLETEEENAFCARAQSPLSLSSRLTLPS